MTEALWRVVQEALMNEHAAARSVQIDPVVKVEEVTLRVADDGLGLPPTIPGGPVGWLGRGGCANVWRGWGVPSHWVKTVRPAHGSRHIYPSSVIMAVRPQE
ncbi:MAG: hypothetical protein U0401_17730 [Anaerolineae bacterium]